MLSCKGEESNMSSFVENTTCWRVYEEEYELLYSLTHSINNEFEDFELWEYGIHCVLYNKNKDIISTSEVKHISSDRAFVLGFIQKIVINKVFPVHLLDVISDMLGDLYLV